MNELLGATVGAGMGIATNNMNMQNAYDLSHNQMNNQTTLNLQNQQLNKEMWNYTNYENQMKHMESAGLNPALMYAKGGQGGTTGNMNSSAPTQQAPRMDIASSMASVAQLGLIQAQTEKTKAEAEKIKGADTDNTNANTKTINDSRDYLVENLKQTGITTLLDRKIKAWLTSDEDVRKETEYNDTYDYHVAVGERSQYSNQISTALLKTASETDINLANIDLTNKKIEFYWQELLNETKKADAQGIQAAAQKLSVEWSTGEYTNWKTWADQAHKSIQSIGSLIKGSKNVHIENPTTTTTTTNY